MAACLLPWSAVCYKSLASPRECMRPVHDCYPVTVRLGSKAWRDTAHEVELLGRCGAGSAIKVGLLAVSVILFGQG